MTSDLAWQRIGQQDPYYGVITDDRFHGGKGLDEFFNSGEVYIGRILSSAAEFVPGYTPTRAVDFGCGVGRLVIPLARRISNVVGIDVSPGMIAEARRNCQSRAITNVEFCQSPFELQGTFDFIHSFIVFQHIPVKQGLRLADALIDKLAEGGIGALHFTYATSLPGWQRSLHRLYKWIPGLHNIANVLKGRPFSFPLMQMNLYPLDALLQLLRSKGCHKVTVSFSDHGGYLGALLIFQRKTLPGY